MNTKLILPLLLLAAFNAQAQQPDTAAPAHSENSAHKESSSSANATSTSVSTSVSSSSGTMPGKDGKTLTINRQRGPDGKETITVTTIGKNGKPKVETLTAEEFEKKYGDHKKKKDAPPATGEKPGSKDGKDDSSSKQPGGNTNAPAPTNNTQASQ